jgi:hypothetical protein
VATRNVLASVSCCLPVTRAAQVTLTLAAVGDRPAA